MLKEVAGERESGWGVPRTNLDPTPTISPPSHHGVIIPLGGGWLSSSRCARAKRVRGLRPDFTSLGVKLLL